ncbi:hypothetical protein [Staphylococcus equorum]|uniref:hypothetical protein n=1 Tax=Staphylococcus equorum TaxID=246432 RepID=UPI000852F569|nr:hypothetical protein [Staphylococcus equorum]OEK60623.1 hypothetical protein ASS99_11210 [Staphylococcus equorum]
MTTLIKDKQIRTVYERVNLTKSDINSISGLGLTIAELEEDTRIFENLNEYVQYIYYADYDMVPLIELTQFMVENKVEKMTLKEILLYDNAMQLENDKILLMMC